MGPGACGGHTDGVGTAREVLDDLVDLGEFFAVTTNPAEAVDPAWRPLADLFADPEPLADRIAHVRRVLDTDERVAASITVQGMAARLLSPPFAALAVHGWWPAPDVATWHWRVSTTGPWPLWVAAPGGRAVDDPGEAGALLAAGVVEAQLRPLVTAVRAQVSVSERVLWGNCASSFASGARLIGTARPAGADRAVAIVLRVLAAGPLAGRGELRGPVGRREVCTYRRATCCLYYRVPGGGTCGDCVLAGRPDTR